VKGRVVAGERGDGRRRSWLSPRLVELQAVATLVGVSVLVFLWRWAWPSPRTGAPDSFWYLRMADRFAGASPNRAAIEAGAVYCADVQRAHRLGALARGCTVYTRHGVRPRYQEIFDARPGYPLTAAPLVRVFGLGAGMTVTTALLFVLIAVLAYAALRMSRLSRLGAAMAALGLGVLPLGYWSSRMLSEGASIAGLTAVALSVALSLRRPRWSATLLLVGALAYTFAARPPLGAAACVTILPVATILAVVDRRRGRPTAAAWLAIATTTLGMALSWVALSSALGIPGLSETAQDLATRHFSSPGIAHPIRYLVRRAIGLWASHDRFLLLPWPYAIVGAASFLILWRLRERGVIWVLLAATSVVVVSAHPLSSEYPRLAATAWIVVAAGAGVLLDAVRDRSRMWRRRTSKRDRGRRPAVRVRLSSAGSCGSAASWRPGRPRPPGRRSPR